MPIRFCAYQYQNVDPDRPRSTMLDGPATLAVTAVTTGGILDRVCADVIPGLRETTT